MCVRARACVRVCNHRDIGSGRSERYAASTNVESFTWRVKRTALWVDTTLVSKGKASKTFSQVHVLSIRAGLSGTTPSSLRSLFPVATPLRAIAVTQARSQELPLNAELTYSTRLPRRVWPVHDRLALQPRIRNAPTHYYKLIFKLDSEYLESTTNYNTGQNQGAELYDIAFEYKCILVPVSTINNMLVYSLAT